MQGIYTTGCVPAFEKLFQQYLYYVAGVGIGILVFQLVNIMLTAGLAIDVRKEQKAMKQIKRQQGQQKRLDKDMAKL